MFLYARRILRAPVPMEALMSASSSALLGMRNSPAATAGAQAFYCFVAALFSLFALDMIVHVAVAQGEGAGQAVVLTAACHGASEWRGSRESCTCSRTLHAPPT